MTITKKFSAVIIDHEKISDINKVLVKYAESSRRASSHVLFNIKPINMTDLDNDLTFFRLTAENEDGINNKLKELIKELDNLDTDYGIRDEETGEIFSSINSVCALNIKFDNIKIIPKGTYKKIDALKNIKIESGYTVGYQPAFRPMESKELENIEIKDEVIYMLSRTSENQAELKNCLSEKIMKIDSNLILEYETFYEPGDKSVRPIIPMPTNYTLD